MRVTLDISTLGLGTLHSQPACSGLLRADEQLVDALAASGECELAFCANHSSIAYDGARHYLRARPALSHHPLVAAPRAEGRALAGRGIASTYRWARTMFPRGLPRLVRSGGQLLDRRLHGAVVEGPTGADVFHSTHFPLPARLSGRSPQRFVTIYDLRHWRFPGLYDARSIAAARAIAASVSPADWVITTSEASRTEILESGLARPGQVFVVPLAADRRLFRPCRDAHELRRVRARYGIGDGRYILSLNSSDVRKNLHRAVRAFAHLVRQEQPGELQFVIAGSAGPGTSPLAAAIAEAADLRGRIVQTGSVEDADLAALYSGATAFLYPSFYEGFGLPPLEAMQCGAPVITSNTSSLPEVVGDAGIMVPPEDRDALCAALLDVLTKPALRRSLREKAIARAATFSWARTAAATLAAYRTATDAI
jgi:glycosyltransferase involved in cell wall biosynthesis